MAQQTIVAYFDSRSEAKAARNALVADGVPASAITLLPEDDSTYTRDASAAAYDHRRDEGGFFASLGNLFLPDEDRYAYAEGLSRGGIALSVMTDDANYGRVADLLERSGADNIDEREAEWRSAGWTGYVGDTAAGATAQAATMRSAGSGVPGDDDVIQVVEEQLRVGKRMTEGGRVRIRSYVVETPVEAEVELRAQHVTIERRAVDRPATAADLAAGDRTLEATERREEAVVSKEARVVEEIGLRQETEVQHQRIQDTVRKTEVEVEDERVAAEREAERLHATRPLTD
ncbi:YsnF/AvaK domain-containing protein [Rubellimicrobium aerolatum]|uniref:YsnF/AvaK domain-containing protein n=1 Tax=Rubellimicrobium aerolatum TaxID=490979 RepID=A0ABW0SH77_9RHOB|nr:YsnF/AvaK domain-containing protein [Rubellimicrobium aerolatum]MBP1807650.1 uncharacterized protein (TIGR02271 family) [Rubellimicrobium aerolatum]